MKEENHATFQIFALFIYAKSHLFSLFSIYNELSYTQGNYQTLNAKYTSYLFEVSDEKLSWCDLPLCLETEDLVEDPEARIGTGDGETWSQGEDEVTAFN